MARRSLVVVANRLPVDEVVLSDGSVIQIGRHRLRYRPRRSLGRLNRRCGMQPQTYEYMSKYSYVKVGTGLFFTGFHSAGTGLSAPQGAETCPQPVETCGKQTRPL